MTYQAYLSSREDHQKTLADNCLLNRFARLLDDAIFLKLNPLNVDLLITLITPRLFC